MTRATTWASALLIALLLSTSYLLDGPSDIATEAAVAADVADAQANAAGHKGTQNVSTLIATSQVQP